MPKSAQPLLVAEGLFFSYSGKTVLHDVSLHASVGEVVGLLGANGAGKTTALRVLSGVLPPERGIVTLNGLTVVGDHARDAQKILGYLPENPGLYPDITTLEYLTFLAAAHGKGQEDIMLSATQTACTQVFNQPMETLSKGWRQRVYLAGVLLHKPKLLILDEPTDGLDPIQRDEMYSVLSELKKSCAIILSTHRLDEAESLCDRLVVLANGKVQADGTPKALQGRAKTFATVFKKLVQAPKEGIPHA